LIIITPKPEQNIPKREDL